MLTFLINITIGFLTAYVATKKGQNRYLWFILGCFFNIIPLAFLVIIFPLIGYFIKSFIKKKLSENYTSNHFRQNEPNEGTVTLEVTPKDDLIVEPSALQKLWYFLDTEGTQIGPMTFSVFRQKWKEGKIRAKTLIRNETLKEWTPFQAVFPQFCDK